MSRKAAAPVAPAKPATKVAVGKYTREQIEVALQRMNALRDAMDRARSDVQRDRLFDRYQKLTKTVAPYVEGQLLYAESEAA